jgi:hypothetical protein
VVRDPDQTERIRFILSFWKRGIND